MSHPPLGASEPASEQEVYEATLRHLLAPIQPYLDDPEVSEVLINGPDTIYVERGGRLAPVSARFTHAGALEAAMRNVLQFVGKRLDPEHPSIEARLPDGTRVHLVHGPAARNGLCVSFRKFQARGFTLDDLIAAGSLTQEMGAYLEYCIRAERRNIIVSGGTGSGKTTLLNTLSGCIDPEERILVLEDASELRLQQTHVVYFEVQAPGRDGQGGISLRELLRAALRLRPDRIIVGECRGGEALDMIQAMTTGHSGSLSTCHATSPLDALQRLETMALMAGVDLPLPALRAQLASAVDVIVQVNRQHDGRRGVTAIAEVEGLDECGAYRLRSRFEGRGHKWADPV